MKDALLKLRGPSDTGADTVFDSPAIEDSESQPADPLDVCDLSLQVNSRLEG